MVFSWVELDFDDANHAHMYAYTHIIYVYVYICVVFVYVYMLGIMKRHVVLYAIRVICQKEPKNEGRRSSTAHRARKKEFAKASRQLPSFTDRFLVFQSPRSEPRSQH